MTRVGCADFYHSSHEPVRREKYFREVIDRHHWDHPFHALREQVPYPTLKGATTTSQDAGELPRRCLNRSFCIGLDDNRDGYIMDRKNYEGIKVPRQRMCGEVCSGQSPLDVKLPARCLRASRSSGALPFSAKLSMVHGDTGHATRGEDMTNLHGTASWLQTHRRSLSSTANVGDPHPSASAHESSLRGKAGWTHLSDGRLPHPSRGRHVMPSFSRIYNT
eukprot:gnl/TRDRNA2_/TRDRNA2_186021_c0_seq1.p1 gnl/TRDRNA2_/TRDRNA2_186021_c0~~gnl/TRDRNA2_/TRDRNA2_186021_c0_seq1.p1  ORF type:complete len:241 (-),score=9.26 gnl/TRDRNA2_/TRDRNA2_186021_c0_seq1:64-723(-)